MEKELEDGMNEESVDSLRLQCKYNGLCNYGTKGQLLMRLAKFKEYSLVCVYDEKVFGTIDHGE